MTYVETDSHRAKQKKKQRSGKEKINLESKMRFLPLSLGVPHRLERSALPRQVQIGQELKETVREVSDHIKGR